MIDTGAIRSKVLELAIQGKLSEQLLEDGNAEELYVLIQEEKQKLIKEGKIKTEKLLADITEEEIPFDIPSNWKWVRLGDCVSILGDGLHGTPKYSTNGEYYFINGNNLKDGKIEIKSDTKCVDFEEYEKYKKTLNDSTVLVSINGTIGNVAFYSEEKVILGKSACYFNMLDKAWKKYIYWIIKTDYFIKYATTKATGVTIKNVSLAAMKLFLIPLPPLEEQERITKKIEDIFNTLDWIDSLQNSYISDSEILKTKIIDAGIQGKLTEQFPEDETAEELFAEIQVEKDILIKEKKIKKEKTLEVITEDEISFEIPNNWKWVRLGDICSKISSGNTPAGGSKGGAYVTEGYCFFREQNIYNDGIHNDGMVYITEELLNTRPNSTVLPKDILLNITGGSIGRCALIPDDFSRGSINQHILIIRVVDPRIRFYIHKCLCSPYYQKLIMGNVVGDKDGFSAGRCKNTLIPLPPIAEQIRIVDKIDELLSLI